MGKRKNLAIIDSLVTPCFRECLDFEVNCGRTTVYMYNKGTIHCRCGLGYHGVREKTNEWPLVTRRSSARGGGSR